MGKYKVNDLVDVVRRYNSKAEYNGRYLSVNHCYNYFNKNYKTKVEYVKNLMTLYFYAYMASWGMLRNSFLLYKDYLFNKPIIELLCKEKKDMVKNNKSMLSPEAIINLKESIIKKYKYKNDDENSPNIYYKEEKEKKVDPKQPDTLVSKIILGTLGILPAYDTFFKFSAGRMGICQSISKNGINQLNDFYKHNKDDVDFMCAECGYPPMKIIDMYFWQKAYECSTLCRIIDIINDKKIDDNSKKNKMDKLIADKNENQLLGLEISKPYDLDDIRKKCEDTIKEYYENAMVNN